MENFIPDISGTTYKFTENTLQEDVSIILEASKNKEKITVPSINILSLHKLFADKLPMRDIPNGSPKQDTKAVMDVMSEARYRRGPQDYTDEYTGLENLILSRMSNKKDIMQIGRFTRKNELQILLPAFANKSFNPLKCSRTSPDLAEVWSLLHLNYMCKDLSQVYGAPVELEIVTDGIVYAPLFNEPIDMVALYKDQLDERATTLGCSSISITDMSDILSTFQSFDSEYHKKTETLSNEWNMRKNKPSIQNLIANTKHNLNLSMYTREDLIQALAYNTKSELSGIISELAEKSALQYQAFVGSLYSEQVLKKTYPQAIRATCHPKPGQRGIHLVGKDSYNYPYNGVAYRTGSKVKVVNEIDMLMDNDIVEVYLEEESKPFFYTKKGTDYSTIVGS